MPTRKAFLATAAGAAATVSGFAQGTVPKSHPKLVPAPRPSPSSSLKQPSKLARELAQSLQHNLPKARLSNAMTEKIASDIQDNFAIGNAFRSLRTEALPPPDFVFTASQTDRP